MSETPSARTTRRWKLQAGFFTTMWLGCLFTAAGTLNWVRGWIYVAIYLFSMSTAGVVVKRRNPGLFEARVQWLRKDTKPFDRVFLSVYLPLSYLQTVVAGLDAVRYHWSSPSLAVAYVGVVLFFLGMGLMTWVMMVNRHAETTVRIQTDRGHAVVSTGPYQWVRHPMYVGMVLIHLGTPLILGSVWALAMAGLIVPLVIWRTAREDRMLQIELPGYREYASKTRYRLVPQVW